MAQNNHPDREFLGLHDPYRTEEPGQAAPRRQDGPLLDREQRGELLRAAATLAMLFLLLALAITVLG